jgi:transcriptional regulator with XRE-family HTH domain
MSEFSEKLKATRKNRGIKQREIANILNVNRSTYAYYEAGKTEPSIIALKEICNFFNCDYSDILPTLQKKKEVIK